MGRPGDKRRQKDSPATDAEARGREQRRRLEQASRVGRSAGERTPGASRPEHSSLDTAARFGEAASEVAHHGVETFLDAGARGIGLEGLGAAGALASVALKGREVVKAIGETHDAHLREAQALGTRHGLAVMMADCNNASSPQIRDGVAYSKADFGRRVGDLLGSDRDHSMRTLQIENSDAPRQYESARDALVDQANSVLKQGQTAAERQALLRTFTDAAAQAMAPGRRQWNQQPQGGPGE
ncbi:MAG: hypothetical protein ACYCYF_08370 [Anaerolineae bacterium]